MSLQGPVEGVVLGRPSSLIGNNAAPIHGSWPDLDIRPDSDPAPLLDEGSVVDVVVTNAKVRTAFRGRSFLEMRCEVLDGGARRIVTTPDGEVLPMVLAWYLPLPQEKSGRRRRFRVSKASKFWRAWVTANGGRKPARTDQMALSVFDSRLLRVTVRTVKTTSQGSALPECFWHSVVDDIAP